MPVDGQDVHGESMKWGEGREVPLVSDRNHSADGLGEALEGRVREIEVRLGGIAPASFGSGRAGIGGRHHDAAARVAVLALGQSAHDLEARAAAEPVVEQGIAQRRGRGPVSDRVQVAVSTGSACSTQHTPHDQEQPPPTSTSAQYHAMPMHDDDDDEAATMLHCPRADERRNGRNERHALMCIETEGKGKH